MEGGGLDSAGRRHQDGKIGQAQLAGLPQGFPVTARRNGFRRPPAGWLKMTTRLTILPSRTLK
jgi:hypothetical protein